MKNNKVLKIKEFINGSKLAARLGIPVTKRELTWHERMDLCDNNDKGNISPFVERLIHIQMNNWGVPKYEITFTYNNQLIQRYE